MHAHSVLLVNLKPKSRQPNGQLLKLTKISRTKGPPWGEVAWLYLVTWLEVCLLETASRCLFDMDVIQGLSQALALQRRRKQELHIRAYTAALTLLTGVSSAEERTGQSKKKAQ